MDMRQLRYFVQIVESGSLSKASRQLFIAQPSLSQQMASLEDEIGQALLVRSVRGMTPTANGDVLYHHAKFILRKFEEAMAAVRQGPSHWIGRVTLGLPPTTVHILGLPLLKHLRRKYPGITLNVVEALSAQLEDMARVAQIDLALMIRQNKNGDLPFSPLLEETLYAILPETSTLIAANKKSITLAELAKLPLLLPSSPMHSLRRRIMAEFERAELPVHIAGEVDSLILLLRLVGEGQGVTIRTMSVTKLLYTMDQWRCVPIADAKMELTHFICTLPEERLSPGAALVRAELKEVVRQLVLSGEWPGTRLCEHLPDATEA